MTKAWVGSLVLILAAGPTFACRMVCDTHDKKGKEHFLVFCYENDESRYKILLDGEDTLRNISCDFDKSDKLLSRCYLEGAPEQVVFESHRSTQKRIVRPLANSVGHTELSDILYMKVQSGGSTLELKTDLIKEKCSSEKDG